MDSLWILDEGFVPFLSGTDSWSLHAQVDRRVRRNPGDWTAEKLLDKLGALDASAKRFALFLGLGRWAGPSSARRVRDLEQDLRLGLWPAVVPGWSRVPGKDSCPRL